MIYFVVPAYNEAPNLPRLLNSLWIWSSQRREPCHVIPVDDGSRDDTPAILASFNKLPITVVRHSVNRNVHEVFRSGFEAWRKLPWSTPDLVVTIEADQTSSLDILDEMVARARNGDDVVLASCYAPGGEVVGTTLYRTLLSSTANLILRCTPGMPSVSTFSSFYRVYRAPFLAHALEAYGSRLIEAQGFVCVVEMLLKFGRIDARISEVPLRLDGKQRVGASKMKVVRTIRGYLGLFLRAITGRVAQPAMLRLPVAEASMTKGVGAD
jgi:dolichol-phosphate mannosyltransferase